MTIIINEKRKALQNSYKAFMSYEDKTYITINKVTDTNFCTKTNTKYFVDEVAENGCISNISSYDTLADAYRRALEIADQYNLEIK